MLGRYCGLRINECYGLKWDHINLKEGWILIDRQMQYQNGLIVLTSVKTRKAKRKIYIPEKLKSYLTIVYVEKCGFNKSLQLQREQNQIFIVDVDGEKISSLDLVNCTKNGKIQTNNSMKFHSKAIVSKYGFPFKYQYLRHTYATTLATLNTPENILSNQLGLGISDLGLKILENNLSQL